MRQHGDALQSAAEDLRGDREFFLDRGREKGFVLKYTSDDLKRDREIVLVDGDAAARSRKTHVEVDDHGRQSLGLRRCNACGEQGLRPTARFCDQSRRPAPVRRLV